MLVSTIPLASPTVDIVMPSQLDIGATNSVPKFVSLQYISQLGHSGLQPVQISPNVIVDIPRHADLEPVVTHQVVKRIEAVPIIGNVDIQGSISASASASAGLVSASAVATSLGVGASALPSASFIDLIDIQTPVDDVVASHISAIKRQRLQTLIRETALASAVTDQRLQEVERQITRARLREALANDVIILGKSIPMPF